MLFCFALPSRAQFTPQVVSFSAQGDGFIRLLWNNGDGTFSLWRVNADATVTPFTFGPYPGWTAISLVVGPDNFPRILWNKTDGTAALYRVNEYTGTFTAPVFGPYAGWTAVAPAVDQSNTSRLLWNKTDGTMSLYKINSDGTFTAPVFGPYAGWTAKSLAIDGNNFPRILWTNTDGRASLWADADVSTAATIYPAVSGNTYLGMTVGAYNEPLILWNHPSDNTVSLWTVASNGTYTSQSIADPPGFTPKGLSASADGNDHLLWIKSDGSGAVQVDLFTSDGTPGAILNLLPTAASNLPQTGGSWVLDHYNCSGSSITNGNVVNWPTNAAPGMIYNQNGSSSVGTSPTVQFAQPGGVGGAQNVYGIITPVFKWTGPNSAPAGTVNVLVTGWTLGYGSSLNVNDGLGDAPTAGNLSSFISTGSHLVPVTVYAGQASFTVPATGSGYSLLAKDSVTGFGYGSSLSLSASATNLSLGGHSTVDNGPPAFPRNPAWDPTHPRFFSGTNCSATASVTAFIGYSVRQIQILVGGILTKEYDDTASPPANQDPNVIYSSGYNQNAVSLTVNFDSTHFADASPIPIQMLVTDSGGNTFNRQIQASAYNEGYVGYEPLPGNIGGNFGQPTAANVDSAMAQCHISTTDSTPTDTRDAVLGAVKSNTTFFTYSNGQHNPDVNNHIFFEPPAGVGNMNGLIFANQGFDPSSTTQSPRDDVAEAIAKKQATPPPFNFVFLDVCNGGYNSEFATGFGIPLSGNTDRAFLGWNGWVEDSNVNRAWTQLLYTYLQKGKTLDQALSYADQITGGPPQDNNPNSVQYHLPCLHPVFGDKAMTLHGAVYQGTNWFK